jgi:3D (Asp-Asp-Asp) domain-containing protein
MSRSPLRTPATRTELLAIAAAVGALVFATGAAASARPSGGTGGSGVGSGGPSGGAGLGGLAPTKPPAGKLPKAGSKHAKGKWIRGFTLSEYWPAPESWFVGRLVRAPGLPGTYPIDWLYSATGISMEGEGLGLDGRLYHIAQLGNGGWVTAAGVSTSAAAGWPGGAPYWRAGDYWRNRSGAVTFPLQRGGWSSGRGRRYVPLRGVSFAVGASLPLRYYRSIAVDPRVIPLGSRVYIPAYRHDGYGGWFVAQDTGGAIGGRHVDVFRSPPSRPTESGQYLTGERVFVVRPRR